MSEDGHGIASLSQNEAVTKSLNWCRLECSTRALYPIPDWCEFKVGLNMVTVLFFPRMNVIWANPVLAGPQLELLSAEPAILCTASRRRNVLTT
jgi:hypothetical protein